jgi:hypothetical protein
MKLKVGLYGAAVNVAAVLGILLFSAVRGGGVGFNAYFSALPVLSAAAFVVYYFVVSAYVAKRPGIQNPVFFDSLVGMLAELIIITLGVVLHSVWMSILEMQGWDFMAFAADLATGILMNFLWIFATFMIHILVIGNIAGLVGWYVLKKVNPKELS